MGRRQRRAKNGGRGHWGKGKREGAVEFGEGLKMGFRGQVLARTALQAGLLGVGSQAGAWSYVLSPLQLFSRNQSLTKQGLLSGELDRYRGGPPPLCVPLHKAGRDRGRSQASGVRPAPAVVLARKPPHTARPPAWGGARGRVRRAEHRPLERAPGPALRGPLPPHRLTKRGRSGHADLGAGS